MRNNQLNRDFFEKYYYTMELSFYNMSKKTGFSVGALHRAFHKLELTPIKHKQWNEGHTYKTDKRIPVGDNHPRWIDGRTYPIDFKTMRKEIINGETRCSVCGKVATALHHIDKNIHNNNKDNLSPMCSSCHTIYHNIDRWLLTAIAPMIISFIKTNE